MLVTEKAEHHGENRQQSAGNVGSLSIIARVMADEEDNDGQQCHVQRDAGAVNGYASAPLAKIVTLGLEDKPFVPEKETVILISDAGITASR